MHIYILLYTRRCFFCRFCLFLIVKFISIFFHKAKICKTKTILFQSKHTLTNIVIVTKLYSFFLCFVFVCFLNKKVFSQLQYVKKKNLKTKRKTQQLRISNNLIWTQKTTDPFNVQIILTALILLVLLLFSLMAMYSFNILCLNISKKCRFEVFNKLLILFFLCI